MKLITENKRVFRHCLILTTALLAPTLTVLADHDKTTGSADKTDKTEHADKFHGDKAAKFIHEASEGGQMEVKMGQLGEQNGQSQEVKDLAQRLVQDHQQANQELQSLAQKKNIQVSAEAGKHQHMLDKLQSKSGAEFDKAFVTMAVKDHKKDIAKFEKCSKDMNDPDLKAFIDKTLPTLRQHLQMAQDAARKLGVSEATLSATDKEENEAAGAPAAGEKSSGVDASGQLDKDRNDLNRNQNADQSDKNLRSDTTFHGTVPTPGGTLDSDSSLTVHKNTATADNTGLNRTDTTASTSTASTDVNVETGAKKHRIFSTDKDDGKLLGIIPWRKHHKASVDTEMNRESTGNAPSSSQGSGSSSSSNGSKY